ncbi:DUF1513 domain-containing protein [Litoreibacter arenae]|uniref:Putative exported protein n=1 Tax=Litoreibacter arenae DSM 19593 TaxID=1123360 RepID=S9QFQ9_9RHOB|nr:DUF1513 domain-containing protein [Litoreibacter arenae]EPX80276.1 putative exported protein [Litoreibacter arenae DSM 19593]
MALTGRRQFLGGLLAAGLVPKPTWADAGSPAFLSAAATKGGSYVLCGIDAGLNVVFQLPLPDRGHAAAGHPSRPEAVAFARRPGTFAVVIDCVTGRQTAVLNAPEGRHFYGHGAFSADGSLLYTTENDFEAGRGRVGVWDAASGYARIGEWDSGGIGPHDIKRLPNSDILVVANGGIDTHPDTGRTKLNLPTMRPNLAYIDQGVVVETAELSRDMHKNSIRHLAVSGDGTVVFGMQWQGDDTPPPLVGLHRMGGAITLPHGTDETARAMDGYIGSIAFAENGKAIAVTSPRGGRIQVFDPETLGLSYTKTSADVCGVAPSGRQFITTSGTGEIERLGQYADANPRHLPLMFDNHLVSL